MGVTAKEKKPGSHFSKRFTNNQLNLACISFLTWLILKDSTISMS